jgi:hypothetical protein
MGITLFTCEALSDAVRRDDGVQIERTPCAYPLLVALILYSTRRRVPEPSVVHCLPWIVAVPDRSSSHLVSMSQLRTH